MNILSSHMAELTGFLMQRIFYVDTWKGGTAMETRVQKWGNSLALRIPKPLADEMGVKDNAPVRIFLKDGQLVVTPVARPALKLADLLSLVTEANLHREVDTGPASGSEAW
jgi:antitoxin MazE